MATLLKYFKPKVGTKRTASNIVPTSTTGVKPVKKKVKILSPEVRQIIEEKRSYLFYKNEYLDKLNSQNFHPRNINLPCSHELTYNKGNVNTYLKATEVVGRHIKE